MSVLTDPALLSLLHAALFGAAQGALEHLTTTPPGGLRRYQTLARAALVAAVLAAVTAAT